MFEDLSLKILKIEAVTDAICMDAESHSYYFCRPDNSGKAVREYPKYISVTELLNGKKIDPTKLDGNHNVNNGTIVHEEIANHVARNGDKGDEQQLRAGLSQQSQLLLAYVDILAPNSIAERSDGSDSYGVKITYLYEGKEDDIYLFGTPDMICTEHVNKTAKLNRTDPDYEVWNHYIDCNMTGCLELNLITQRLIIEFKTSNHKDRKWLKQVMLYQYLTMKNEEARLKNILGITIDDPRCGNELNFGCAVVTLEGVSNPHDEIPYFWDDIENHIAHMLERHLRNSCDNVIDAKDTGLDELQLRIKETEANLNALKAKRDELVRGKFIENAQDFDRPGRYRIGNLIVTRSDQYREKIDKDKVKEVCPEAITLSKIMTTNYSIGSDWR